MSTDTAASKLRELRIILGDDDLVKTTLGFSSEDNLNVYSYSHNLPKEIPAEQCRRLEIFSQVIFEMIAQREISRVRAFTQHSSNSLLWSWFKGPMDSNRFPLLCLELKSRWESFLVRTPTNASI